MFVQYLLVLLVIAATAQGQTPMGKLRGRVKDAVTQKGIPAAEIAISEVGGTFHKAVISNADGTYSAGELTLARKLEIRYSANGYGPASTKRVATLTGSELVMEDVLLLCDCPSANYWKSWATEVWKRAKHGKGESTQAAADAWEFLGAAGLSAEARSQAANELVSMDAVLLRGEPFRTFAMYDAGMIVRTEKAVRLSLFGDSQVTPPDVAVYVPASIAVAEVRKEAKDVPSQERLLWKLQKDWGAATVEEAIKINRAMADVQGRGATASPHVRIE